MDQSFLPGTGLGMNPSYVTLTEHIGYGLRVIVKRSFVEEVIFAVARWQRAGPKNAIRGSPLPACLQALAVPLRR